MRLLAHIKGDLEFNRNLYNLIDALGKISVSQYYMLEKKNKSFDKVSTGVGDIIAILNLAHCRSPFAYIEGRQPGVVAVTSDSGLLGGLNMQVMNLALKDIKEQGARLIVIGERGRLFAAENNIGCASFPGVNDETRFSQAAQVRDYVTKEVFSLKLGRLKILYPQAISIISQKVQALELLPFSSAADAARRPADIIMESTLDDAIDYLVYILLGNKLYEIFGLARLAELSARFIHLENSKTKLDELSKQLKLQYFRQKHELTDRTMRELFTARLAFKK